MAHFYGQLVGNGGTHSSRNGTKSTGLEAIAASWNGAVQVHLWFDEETQKDWARVQLIPWPDEDGKGTNRVLFIGPVDGSGADEKL